MDVVGEEIPLRPLRLVLVLVLMAQPAAARYCWKRCVGVRFILSLASSLFMEHCFVSLSTRVYASIR